MRTPVPSKTGFFLGRLAAAAAIVPLTESSDLTAGADAPPPAATGANAGAGAGAAAGDFAAVSLPFLAAGAEQPAAPAVKAAARNQRDSVRASIGSDVRIECQYPKRN
jgi:hypothetical protein